MRTARRVILTEERRWRHGLAMVEVLLALLVIVLGAWLALALVGRLQQRRRCEVFIADLQAFAAVLQEKIEPGRAKPVPAAEEALQGTNWSKGSPFGGEYGWVAPYPPRAAGPTGGRGSERTGAITLTAFAPHFPLKLSGADLRYVDERIDDGNLATGKFRTGHNGWPVYLVGEKP